MKVKIKKLHPNATVPKYATSGSSGFDLVAIETVTFMPGETKLIETGLAFDVSPGYELQIRPRSGMSLKTPMRVSNAPGSVDSDFRGQVCVIMTHSGISTCDDKQDLDYTVKAGDRIAQGVVAGVEQAEFEVVESLDETDRGTAGFGSSGQ
jgi:dUTP pyrophosphatase